MFVSVATQNQYPTNCRKMRILTRISSLSNPSGGRMRADILPEKRGCRNSRLEKHDGTIAILATLGAQQLPGRQNLRDHNRTGKTREFSNLQGNQRIEYRIHSARTPGSWR
jgi:hypothetical protein